MNIMKICTYDEVNPEQVLDLNIQAFNWTLTFDRINKIRKLDPRVPEIFAFYAVEKGVVLGQLGIILLELETKTGKQLFGGIWGVATDPLKRRSGIASLLFREAHEFFLERGIEYSLLTTARHIVGYNLYKKLDYHTIFSFPKAVRHQDPSDKPTPPSLRVDKTDIQSMDDMFKEKTKGLLGFTHRPPMFYNARRIWGFINTMEPTFFKVQGEKLGYGMYEILNDAALVREIMSDEKDYTNVLNLIEAEAAQPYTLLTDLSTKSKTKWAEKIGFRIYLDGYPVLMAKDLRTETNKKRIKHSLGIDKGQFHMNDIDIF